MAKDLAITRFATVDKGGTPVTYPSTIQYVIDDGVNRKEFFANTSVTVFTYDDNANYFEIYSQSHCIYKYEPGDTYGGAPVADAGTMASNVVSDTLG
jgi:beta-lactamase class D